MEEKQKGKGAKPKSGCCGGNNSRHSISVAESRCNTGRDKKSQKDSKACSSTDVPPKRYITNTAISNNFVPMPYTFRLPFVQGATEVKNGSVKCPPFYLQLDHTLAVIWCLFCKRDVGRPLGIAQLQWALNFLKTIQSPPGKTPKDVEVCIRVIEDRLIEQYAELVDEVRRDDVKDCGCKKSRSVSNVSYSDGDAPDLTGERKKLAPFSVNYEEMIKYAPVKDVEQIYKAQSQCGCSTQDVNSKMKEYPDLETGQLLLTDKTDKDNMVRFLRSWRKEQIEKIEDELKRLHSIDNYIENVDKENFAPFLDEKQLDVLVATKVCMPPSKQDMKHKEESGCKHKSKRSSEEKVPADRRSTVGYH